MFFCLSSEFVKAVTPDDITKACKAVYKTDILKNFHKVVNAPIGIANSLLSKGIEGSKSLNTISQRGSENKTEKSVPVKENTFIAGSPAGFSVVMKNYVSEADGSLFASLFFRDTPVRAGSSGGAPPGSIYLLLIAMFIMSVRKGSTNITSILNLYTRKTENA